MMSNENKTRLVILISGRGSNMRSIIEAIDAQQIDATVSAVISNRPDAAGLDYAKAPSIPTAVVDHKTLSYRDSFDKALA